VVSGCSCMRSRRLHAKPGRGLVSHSSNMLMDVMFELPSEQDKSSGSHRRNTITNGAAAAHLPSRKYRSEIDWREIRRRRPAPQPGRAWETMRSGKEPRRCVVRRATRSQLHGGFACRRQRHGGSRFCESAASGFSRPRQHHRFLIRLAMTTSSRIHNPAALPLDVVVFPHMVIPFVGRPNPLALEADGTGKASCL